LFFSFRFHLEELSEGGDLSLAEAARADGKGQSRVVVEVELADRAQAYPAAPAATPDIHGRTVTWPIGEGGGKAQRCVRDARLGRGCEAGRAAERFAEAEARPRAIAAAEAIAAAIVVVFPNALPSRGRS
jgi:hypothetical protein